MSILSAAGGDPLRAQEIEERLTPYWWRCWQIYTREKGRAEKEQLRKIKDGES